MKIFKNSLFASREKEKPAVEKSKKLSLKTLDFPRKVVGVKATFPSVKKVEKRPKMAFTAILIFTGKKMLAVQNQFGGN